MFNKLILFFGFIIPFVMACSSPKLHKSPSNKINKDGIESDENPLKSEKTDAIKVTDNIPTENALTKTEDASTQANAQAALSAQATPAEQPVVQAGSQAAPEVQAQVVPQQAGTSVVVAVQPVASANEVEKEEYKIDPDSFDVNNINSSDMQYLSKVLNVSQTLKRGSNSNAGFFNPETNGQVPGYKSDSSDDSQAQGYYQFQEATSKCQNSVCEKVLGNDKYSTYSSNTSSMKHYVYEYSNDYKLDENSPAIDGALEVIKYDTTDSTKDVTIAGRIDVKLTTDKTLTIHFGKKDQTANNQESVVLDDKDFAQSGKFIIEYSSTQKEYDLAALADNDVTLLNALGLFTVKAKVNEE